uniref:Purinergic receptor P2X 7 n=1 Tax=Equus caballus TaxID=9796 RepID=A0A9L0TIP6_HORSE
MPACCSWNDVFQYETNKVTRIQSMNYGTIKWICHLIVFSYVIFALVSDKRYQRKEPLISSVHTKVKGIAEVREEIIESGAKKVVQSVFDTADYTFPLQGNSFFVMTNFLKTEGQEQGLCPEGGIMGIEIYWDCNLDRWFHHCRPKYSFRRLDDKTASESSYPGYNFREENLTLSS